MTPMEQTTNYCPNCGESMALPSSLVVEYWSANDTIHFCWCSTCHWRGEIKKVVRVTTLEIDED